MSYESEEARELEFGVGKEGAEKLRLPAIFLLVTAIINLLLGGYLLFNGIVVMNAPPGLMEKAMEMQPEQNRRQIKEFEKQGFSMDQMMKIGGGFYLVWGIVAILSSVVSIAGGACMLSAKAYGLAVTGAVLTTIPCITSPCFILGLPFGIWSLVVLLNPAGKAAFRR